MQQREAIRAVGHLEQCKEECRDARGVRFIQETSRDVRFGMRLLRKSPGFTATAVAMLAIAIGASATVYSFASTLFLKPMPYGAPEGRLFLLWEKFAGQQLERVAFSAPEVAQLQQNISAFDQVAAFRHTEFNLVNADEPERINAALPHGTCSLFWMSLPCMGALFLSMTRMTTALLLSSSASRFGSVISPPILAWLAGRLFSVDALTRSSG